MKYSGSFWSKDDVQINDVDDRTLDTYILRAGLQDGNNILDLGAGWGSLSKHHTSELGEEKHQRQAQKKIEGPLHQ